MDKEWLGEVGFRLSGSTLEQIEHRPFVMCACNAEGCGLLADGQTCLQLTTRGSAVTVRTFEVLPVAGSPHRRPRSLSSGQGELCLKLVRSGNKVSHSLACGMLVHFGGMCLLAAG